VRLNPYTNQATQEAIRGLIDLEMRHGTLSPVSLGWGHQAKESKKERGQ